MPSPKPLDHANSAQYLSDCPSQLTVFTCVNMQAIGLMEAFNSSTQQLTMFAPLNSAFQSPSLQVSY